jgi:hypothetical protein
MQRHMILFFSAFLILMLASSQVSAQTVIRDTVHLMRPTGLTNKTQTVTTAPRGFLLRNGGHVTVGVTQPEIFMGPGAWELHLNGSVLIQNGMVLEDNSPFPEDGVVEIGRYAQWGYMQLSIRNDSIPDVPHVDFYMDDNSSTIVGDGYAGYLFYRWREDTPDWTFDASLQVWVYADSTLEAIPPLAAMDLMAVSWNPYVRDRYAVMDVAIPGTYRLIIESSHAGGRDDVIMLQPGDTTLMTGAQSRVGDTVILGTFAEGDRIELGLLNRSSPLLNGQTLYGATWQTSSVAWEETFEDWTDLDFDDLTVRVELAVDPPDHLELWSASSTIWYGDTADVDITPTDAHGEFSPLGADALYEYSIELPDSLRQYGELIYRGEPGYSFEHIYLENGVSTELQLAANGVEPDSTVDLSFHLKAIYVGEIIASSIRGGQTGGIILPKSGASTVKKSVVGTRSALADKTSIKARIAANIGKSGTNEVLINTDPLPGDVVLENDYVLGDQPAEILLGESRYYYVVQKGNTLSIKETTSPSFPNVEGIVKDRSVWTDAAVKITGDEDNSGKKLGVYWETEKPKPTGTGNLPAGMIRLIGRFWCEDSVYKVSLEAKNGGLSEAITIKVKKPGMLFDSDVSDYPYNQTKNIRKETLNIDSLCIWYGGRIGISPQVIKGQMFQESDKTGNQFNPSYRYEPWADYGFRHQKSKGNAAAYATQPFWVTGVPPKPLGLGKDVPTEHQNVRPISYPTNAVSIASFVIGHWENLYFLADEDSVIASTSLTKGFRDYVNMFSLFRFLTGDEEMPYSLATNAIQLEIASKYPEYAQTRKGASYGLIQMMYVTAINGNLGFNNGKSIDASSSPEELNDERIEMPFYREFTVRNLNLVFGRSNAHAPEGNWPTGWEQTWKNSFKNYNRHAQYGSKVFNHARKFYPQSNRGIL